MNEKISIIIPCYNTYEYILLCIESVRSQTYKNIELIVVDDGSNNNTKRLLEELSSKIDVLITQENKGQSAARNIGVSKADGKFIVFVDSDDTLENTFLEKLITNYKEEYSVITTYANIIVNKKIIDIFKPNGGGIREALKYNIALGTSMFLKNDLLAISGYDENMRKGFEDWEMLIRLLAYSNKEVFVVDLPLYNYRKGIISTTTTANEIKYDLLRYIYYKHEDLYKVYFKDFISLLLNKIEREEKEKIKMYSRVEYKIGYIILQPFKFIKRVLNV